MSFDININGLSDVNRTLDKLDLAINTEDVLDAGGAYILFKIKERFLRQEAPDGSQWLESTAAKKRKAEGRRGGTLFDTGSLYHSIELGRAGRGERSIYTNVPYARKHQEGLKGLEKRVFLGFSNADLDGVRSIITARIRSALK